MHGSGVDQAWHHHSAPGVYDSGAFRRSAIDSYDPPTSSVDRVIYRFGGDTIEHQRVDDRQTPLSQPVSPSLTSSVASNSK